VSSVNDAPLAVDDGYTVGEDTALTIDAPGVLANDSDIEGVALSASLVTDPAHGTVTVNADGSFTYTPTADFSGSDSFSYRTSDGLAESNVATVLITVSPVNDAPVATNDTATTEANQAVAIAVLENDNDIDGALNPTTVTIVSGPTHGTITIDPITGEVTYTPGIGFIGEDNFTYTVLDDLGLLSNLGTVTVSVTSG
jgi:VCBS repeat-containing protein